MIVTIPTVIVTLAMSLLKVIPLFLVASLTPSLHGGGGDVNVEAAQVSFTAAEVVPTSPSLPASSHNGSSTPPDDSDLEQPDLEAASDLYVRRGLPPPGELHPIFCAYDHRSVDPPGSTIWCGVPELSNRKF